MKINQVFRVSPCTLPHFKIPPFYSIFFRIFGRYYMYIFSNYCTIPLCKSSHSRIPQTNELIQNQRCQVREEVPCDGDILPLPSDFGEIAEFGVGDYSPVFFFFFFTLFLGWDEWWVDVVIDFKENSPIKFYSLSNRIEVNTLTRPAFVCQSFSP